MTKTLQQWLEEMDKQLKAIYEVKAKADAEYRLMK